MDIIVPLSDENYYNLNLDNIFINNEIIIKTVEIINLTNQINLTNLNESSDLVELRKKSNNKIIKKIIDLIKKSNNIGVFDILINVLPYPIWIDWFRSCFILKYYWNNDLIKKIEDSNRFKIVLSILNGENIDNINEINNNTIGKLDKHLMVLTNSYDINYNFSLDIIKKRILVINNIVSQYIEDFEIKNYFGCDNFIFVLGNNNLHKVNCIGNNNDPYEYNNPYTNLNTILTFYPNKNCKLQLKKNTEYNYDNGYFFIKINKLIFKFYKKIVNPINIFTLSNGYVNFENYEIKINAHGYQMFNLNFNDKIKKDTDHYNQFVNDNFISNILRASEQTWFNAILFLNVQKTIKNNFPKCYDCKKIWDGYSLPDYKFHCLECGIKNYKRKNEKACLNDMVFFITGIRVKIGFATALRLLRSGATVIGTTRYPNFALWNYSKEKDYDIWKSKLIIIQADFLVLDSVYSLLNILDKYKINGFINMAFRTIKPSEYYSSSLDQIESELESGIYIKDSDNISNELIVFKPNSKTYFTDLNQVDITGLINYNCNQQIQINDFNDIQDIPHPNSWEQSIDQIDPKEIVECVALNQLVPTLIINKIKNKLVGKNKFIIHIGSFEGQFDTSKTDKHIHTNMCKSALNMLIRSLEEDPDLDLHVHTINPGYVTGVKITPGKTDYPVSLSDAASKITWPIFQAVLGKPLDKSWTKINNYEKAKW